MLKNAKTTGIWLLFCGLLGSLSGSAQPLHPHFEAAEYRELLLIALRTTDNEKYYRKYLAPQHYDMVYRSQEMGLDNRWQLWVNHQHTIAVVSIRGTTTRPASSLANLYAAMVPASGTLHLAANDTFAYQLATHPQAAVHTGWLVSMAFLVRDIRPRIDSLYQAGIRDIILTGHSQGGAIAYLLTAYLYYQQQQGALARDIRFKTYCSAAPKPGNVYFAYDYETAIPPGWSLTVVNTADWVPQMPMSIQTVNDINSPNPFVQARQNMHALPWPRRVIARHIYNKLAKPARKAQRYYEKYLGELTSKYIRQKLPGFEPPAAYVPSSNYVRTGTTIVLSPGKDYYEHFADQASSFFYHHGIEYYLYLTEHKYHIQPTTTR